jgi:hypothetical protein
MIAQAYFDGEPIVRLFDKEGTRVADLPMALPPCDKTADDALRCMKLQRREKWKVASWAGREARVRFVR